MPCRSDHMEPTAREIESNKVAKHLVFLLNRLGVKAPNEILHATTTMYGKPSRCDDYTMLLCHIIGSLTEKQLDAFVYNGRVHESRMLAEWWDNHQELDKKRAAKGEDLEMDWSVFDPQDVVKIRRILGHKL